MRKYLIGHQKDCPNMPIECWCCKLNDTRANIDHIHAKVCPKTPFSCPNAGCSDIIERQGVKRHLEDCEHAQIPCKYAKLGCGAKIKKKDMTSHARDANFHLQLAMDLTAKLQTANASLVEKVGKLESDKKACCTFKMLHYQTKKEVDRVFTSSPFYTSPTGYNLAVKVYTNGCDKSRGTHLGVFVKVVNGRNDCDLLWPFEGDVTVSMLNQLEDKNHLKKTLVFSVKNNHDVGSVWGYSMFVQQSELGYDPVRKTQYLKDDALYFRVSADIADYKPWLECSVTHGSNVI